MVSTISDPLCSEYELLVVTPFLVENQVECTVAKEHGSKLDERADLESLIDREWNKVGIHNLLHTRCGNRDHSCTTSPNSDMTTLRIMRRARYHSICFWD